MIGKPDMNRYFEDFLADPAKAKTPDQRLAHYQRQRADLMRTQCKPAGEYCAQRDELLLGEWEELLDAYENLWVDYKTAAMYSTWDYGTIKNKVSSGELQAKNATVRLCDLPIAPGTGIVHALAAFRKITTVAEAQPEEQRKAKRAAKPEEKANLPPRQRELTNKAEAAANRLKKAS